jgi:hypothetical protein|tara:strand:+ start:147 stop:275 length:129 start_codon:yes stop_codon:yes gene_type:complete
MRRIIFFLLITGACAKKETNTSPVERAIDILSEEDIEELPES